MAQEGKIEASPELQEQIRAILSEEFEVEIEKIQPDAELIDTLSLDSLDMVDVVVLVELKWGITLVAEDFQGLRTFSDFYNLIATKRANA